MEFVNVWKDVPEELFEQIDEVWRIHGRIENPEERMRRLGELVVVAKSGDKIAGLSTAHRVHVNQLDNWFYSFRCLVVPEFRAPGLDTKLVVLTKQFLENKFDPGKKDQPIGMIMVIQNEMIKNHWRQAVWPGADMMYIGDSTRGEHVRLTYFKGAKI